MPLLKFVFYSLVAYLVIRLVMRLISPPRKNNPQHSHEPRQNYSGPESLEKPRFTIEAESVDYEIIEEPKDENKK